MLMSPTEISLIIFCVGLALSFARYTIRKEISWAVINEKVHNLEKENTHIDTKFDKVFSKLDEIQKTLSEKQDRFKHNGNS